MSWIVKSRCWPTSERRGSLPGSLQVFGGVHPKLRDLAREILKNLPVREAAVGDEMIDADQFAMLANQEIQYYRDQSPTLLGSGDDPR